MILLAGVIVLGLAAILFVSAVAYGRSTRGELSRYLAEKKAAWEHIREREAELDRREATLLGHERRLIEEAAQERQKLIAQFAEERRELLDRIQAPQMVAARMLPSAEGEPQPVSDEDVDREFMKDPASQVPWDDDLAPVPWDPTPPPDDVPSPTSEPVRP